MTTLEERKKRIARQYCASIAVIDDEALIQEEETTVIGEAYQALARECQTKSLLLHLQQYPKGIGAPYDDGFKIYFDNAVKVARAADVIVLDWHLGIEEGPAHAIELLKELSTASRLHFVLIYTGHADRVGPDLEKIGFVNLRTASPNRDAKNGSESDPPETETGPASPGDSKAVYYVKDGKLFASVRPKNEADDKSIVEEIYSLILHTYPGLLPWAGLELAIRLKDIVSRLLVELPSDIDEEIAINTVHKTMPNEVAKQFADLLLDEALRLINEDPLNLLQDAALKELIPPDLHNLAPSAETHLRKLIKNFNNNTTPRLNVPRHLKLNAFVESYVMQPVDTTIAQGTVLQKDEEYLLCISPLCDLYRLGDGNYVTFLAGRRCSDPAARTSSAKHVRASLFASGEAQQIEWDLTEIISKPATREGTDATNAEGASPAAFFKDYLQVGQLRPDIVQRIIHRAWAHRTRIGTDIVEVVRLLRDEK